MMKLLTVAMFVLPGIEKACNGQEFDVEIELWLRFWGPWVARMQARAKFCDEIVDSCIICVIRHKKSMQQLRI